MARGSRNEFNGNTLKRVITRIDYNDIFDISTQIIKEITNDIQNQIKGMKN